MTLWSGSFDGSLQASAPVRLTSPWPDSPLYQILPQILPGPLLVPAAPPPVPETFPPPDAE